METPAWILVIILSVTLFIFLVLGIVLLICLIRVTKEAKKVVIQGQGIAETASDIADNVRDFTTVGGLVRYFVDNYVDKASRSKKRSNAKKTVSSAADKKADAEEKEDE
jgi:biopolymer transport protein ExbB/TolQ